MFFVVNLQLHDADFKLNQLSTTDVVMGCGNTRIAANKWNLIVNFHEKALEQTYFLIDKITFKTNTQETVKTTGIKSQVNQIKLQRRLEIFEIIVTIER